MIPAHLGAKTVTPAASATHDQRIAWDRRLDLTWRWATSAQGARAKDGTELTVQGGGKPEGGRTGRGSGLYCHNTAHLRRRDRPVPERLHPRTNTNAATDGTTASRTDVPTGNVSVPSL